MPTGPRLWYEVGEVGSSESRGALVDAPTPGRERNESDAEKQRSCRFGRDDVGGGAEGRGEVLNTPGLEEPVDGGNTEGTTRKEAYRIRNDNLFDQSETYVCHAQF